MCHVAWFASMNARYFYGWNVVGATFVMALLSFGLGFYGLSVYVASLQRLHGWSASAVSAPVTVYYVAGALLTIVIGDVYERFGPRLVVAAGSAAMAAGLATLGVVNQPWQLYPAFLVMPAGRVVTESRPRLARRGHADMALLERVGALRARPGGAGRRAHASRRARGADARHGRRGARGERDDGRRADRAPRDRRRGRSPGSTPGLERDARRPDRRARAAGVGVGARGRLRGLRLVRVGGRQPDDAAGAHPGDRVAARA